MRALPANFNISLNYKNRIFRVMLQQFADFCINN